jgi:hypothetical protein
MTESVLLQTEVWPIDRFVFYARNPRKNDAAVDQMHSKLTLLGASPTTPQRARCICDHGSSYQYQSLTPSCCARLPVNGSRHWRHFPSVQPDTM